MKPAWKQLLAILALLVFVYVMTLPLTMGGLGYGAVRYARPAWQTSTHTSHGISVLAMGNGLSWTGSEALYSGLIQLGLLVIIVMGSIWLVSALGRHGKKAN